MEEKEKERQREGRKEKSQCPSSVVSLLLDDFSCEVLKSPSILKSTNKNRNDDKMNDTERKKERKK